MLAMNLRTYVDAERGRAADLATALGLSPVMVSQWASGVKTVPMNRCTAIEQATAGVVRRWDLRPNDWHLVWPELIGAKGAPRPFRTGAKASAAKAIGGARVKVKAAA